MPVEVIRVVGCCTLRCTGFRDHGDGWVINTEGTEVSAIAMVTEGAGILIQCPMLAKNPEDARISWCRQSFGSNGKPDRCAYGG